MVEKSLCRLTVIFACAAIIYGFNLTSRIEMDFAPIGPHLNGKSKILTNSDYDFMQRIICGMPATNTTFAYSKNGPYTSYVYFNFGVYGCRNGKFHFQYCLIGGRKLLHEDIKNDSFERLRENLKDKEDLHVCEMPAFYYIHSNRPDDPATIASHEHYMCQLQRIEGLPVYSTYKNKLLSCRDNKYHFEGCIFLMAYISRESQMASRLNIPEHQSDVCYQLAVYMKVPLEEKASSGLGGMLDTVGTYKLAPSLMDAAPSNDQIKGFYESVVCRTLKMRFFYYDFGVYECVNNEFHLRECFYGDKIEDPDKIKHIIMSQRGDYIDNTNDLRFCSQLISTFTLNDRSYSPENIWKQEDYMCEMANKVKVNFSVPSECEGPPHNLTQNCQFLRKVHEKEITRVGIFYNFKLMQCDSISKKPFLTGCMYKKDFLRAEMLEEEFKKERMQYVEFSKIICLLPIVQKTQDELDDSSVLDRRATFDEFAVTIDRECETEKWFNATVLYYIDSRTTKEEQNYVYNAIQEYERYTCLNFRKLSAKSKEKYFYIKPEFFDKCKENVSDIFLRSDCSSYFLYFLGFRIGMTNELFRPDRENWIASMLDMGTTIKKFKEIIDGPISSPLFVCPTYSTEQPFDYLQPIYYDNRFYEKSEPKFVALMKFLDLKPRYGSPKLWSAKGLTYCSVAKLNKMYQCDPKKYITDCHGLTGEIKP